MVQSKKRHQSTDEDQQTDDPKAPSPKKPKASRRNTSDESPPKRKDSKHGQFKTPSPVKELKSSPLTTPKTPRAASKLAIPADTAKMLLKYASRLNPLVSMIYTVTQYFTERKEDMRTREDFLPMLVDCVKSLVPTFSYLLSTLIARMLSSSTKSHFQD